MSERTYTAPAVLHTAPADPTGIDWAARQASAVIPFEVVHNRPVNPFGPTGVRYGRNELKHWGEKLCVDALVIARLGLPYVLMIERGDGHGWALPGGKVDPGETPDVAVVRETEEEAGFPIDSYW